MTVKKNTCYKGLPPGEISNNILNPLTTIKGYLQLQRKTKQNLLEEDVILELLLSEIEKIEDIVYALERMVRKPLRKGKY